MAEPKKRLTSTRSGNRRSHLGQFATSVNKCAKCGAPKMPHRVCSQCGFYGKEQIVDKSIKLKK